MSTVTLPGLFKILADPVRLRALGLLAREELSAGELARILGLQATRLSNHLRILREAGLVAGRKEGTWTFVRLDRRSLPPALWAAVEEELARSPDAEPDLRRLEALLEERRIRSRSYFDRVAGEWDAGLHDFRTGSGRQRVAARLVSPSLVVADVGAGTGYLAGALSGLVSRVILVDHSQAMLDLARKNLSGARAQVEIRPGEIDALPLRDGEVDAVVAGLVAHHAPDLTAFLREALRVLKPGGVLVVEDLLPHREAWMRESMADLRLGIEPRDIEDRMTAAGFLPPSSELLEDSYRPERPDGTRADLPLFLTCARKGPNTEDRR